MDQSGRWLGLPRWLGRSRPAWSSVSFAFRRSHLNVTLRRKDSPRCPHCGGFVITTSRMSASVTDPLPHVQSELGECQSCALRVRRNDDGPWRVNPTPMDDRLDELLTSDVESRIRSKNVTDWIKFVDRMNTGDELWTLAPSSQDYVMIAIVNNGMIRELKRFKR